jgi:hypothetical protein
MSDKETTKEEKPVNPIRNRRDYGDNFLDRLADLILPEKDDK